MFWGWNAREIRWNPPVGRARARGALAGSRPQLPKLECWHSRLWGPRWSVGNGNTPAALPLFPSCLSAACCGDITSMTAGLEGSAGTPALLGKGTLKPDRHGCYSVPVQTVDAAGWQSGQSLFMRVYSGIICLSATPFDDLARANDLLVETKLVIEQDATVALLPSLLRRAGLDDRKILPFRVWRDEVDVG